MNRKTVNRKTLTKLKIAVNTRLLIKDKIDGIGLFTFEIFKIIAKQHPEHIFYFIFDRKPSAEFIFEKNIQSVVLLPKTRHIYLFPFWYQMLLKKALKRLNPDVFIATDGMFPLKSNIKTLAVIHDLNFEHYPETLPKNVLKYYLNYFPQFAKKAIRIATVSQFSKNDIIKTYQINADKIDVVYNGANIDFKPITEEDALKIKSKYTQQQPYFLFVGTLHPRKNILRLLMAFNRFKTQTNSPIKLVLAGRKMWWTKEINTFFEQMEAKNDVIFTGRISNEELIKITAAAYAITYVPIFEGFGIPLVEAMRCGVPVITSNVTAMPEVVENAGLLVNPFSEEEIANAMLKLVSDEKLRTTLAQKSLQQAAKFNWEKSAQLLLKSIEKTGVKF